MKKIAYVLDSTLMTSMKEIENTDIFLQPLTVIVDGKEFNDIVDINVDEFYKIFATGASCSTSQPSPGAFADTYEQLVDEGYDAVIVFTLSSVLSGTYNSAKQAAELVSGIEIHVVDTGKISAVGIEIVSEIIKYAAQHPELSPAEIAEYGQQIFNTVQIYVYIGDLEPLHKGGRLTAVQAFLGKMLQVKPIIGVVDGALEIVTKERTEKKALKTLAKLTREQPFTHAMLLETNEKTVRETAEKSFKELYPEQEYLIRGLCPVIGVHAGLVATGIVTWTM